MTYDKIRGKSVSECMMKLRSRYGSSAIILSTHEVKEGGVLGSGLFSKKMYEIDFMIEEKKKSGGSQQNVGSKALQRALLEAPAEEEAGDKGIRPPAFQKMNISKKSGAAADQLLHQSVRDRSGPDTMGSRRGDKRPNPVLDQASPEEILAILNNTEKPQAKSPDIVEEIPPLLKKVEVSEPEVDVKQEEFPTVPAAPASSRLSFDDSCYTKVRERLLNAQLSDSFTNDFLKSLDNSLSRNEKKEYRKVEERSLERLSEMIRTTPDLAPPRGECRAVMLVGPTGSGKTTSLAKLAARYHIFQERDVSLYSLDHYRLAATEQLKTYASVMGLPFFSPLNVEEFSESIRRDGSELMLIDTSGISHRDPERLLALKAFADACEVRLEKHLVLAANTSPILLEKILLAYDVLGFDKIILTKLDETDFIGAFVEHADKFNRPFSFLMNGQDVPGDILEPEPMEMAKMVLSE